MAQFARILAFHAEIIPYFAFRVNTIMRRLVTHNIGLNVYGLVGLSQYDHEATLWWDTPINQSDSTFWSLGANIKWYWDMPKGADSIARQ
jgi:hypothetical protein